VPVNPEYVNVVVALAHIGEAVAVAEAKPTVTLEPTVTGIETALPQSPVAYA
jgi:hypothetical protein